MGFGNVPTQGGGQGPLTQMGVGNPKKGKKALGVAADVGSAAQKVQHDLISIYVLDSSIDSKNIKYAMQPCEDMSSLKPFTPKSVRFQAEPKGLASGTQVCLPKHGPVPLELGGGEATDALPDLQGTSQLHDWSVVVSAKEWLGEHEWGMEEQPNLPGEGQIQPDLRYLATEWPSYLSLPPAGTLNRAGLLALPIPASNWVLNVAEVGYKFVWNTAEKVNWSKLSRKERKKIRCGIPPPKIIPNVHASLEAHEQFVSARVLEYVESGVVVPMEVSGLKVAMGLKVVKSGAIGKPRLIYTACYLNRYLFAPKFKYETLAVVEELLEQGWVMGKIDVASGYHAIKIHPTFQPYLGFQWKGQFFMFTVLPFGIKPAPWVYTRIMKDVIRCWRVKNTPLMQYIDDTWWAANSKQVWFEQAVLILSTLIQVGFWIGWKKCVLLPVILVEQVGFVIDSEHMVFSLPPRRVNFLCQLISEVVDSPSCSVQMLRSLVGSLISCERAVWGARIQLRILYYLITENEHISKQSAEGVFVSLSVSIINELKWWYANLPTSSQPIQMQAAVHEFYVDASAVGWGAVLNNSVEASGLLDAHEALQSSTFRELVGVREAVVTFWPILTQGNWKGVAVVDVYCDNFGVECIMRKGSSKPHLQHIATEITKLTEAANLKLRLCWLPREFNVYADELSKQVSGELVLNADLITDACLQLHTYPTIHAFTTRSATILKKFLSEVVDGRAERVSFFSQSLGG